SHPWRDIGYEKKRYVAEARLGSDVHRLEDLFAEVCACRWRYRDFARHELREVLNELLACFPVYRTYVRVVNGEAEVREADVRYVSEAFRCLRDRRADLDQDLVRLLEDVLLLRERGSAEDALAMQLQQVAGPIMAKGVEDTAFYCFHRLIAISEV